MADLDSTIVARQTLEGLLRNPNLTPEARAEFQAKLDNLNRERKRAERGAYLEETRETAWAAYHLNFPQNNRGWGPWADERMTLKESVGAISNPFAQSEAEKRVEKAKLENLFRANVRNAFAQGQTREQIVAGAGDWNLAPRDLRKHYGV